MIDLTRRESVEALWRAVMALPRRYREVVLLCDLEEVDYSDAARCTGVSDRHSALAAASCAGIVAGQAESRPQPSAGNTGIEARSGAWYDLPGIWNDPNPEASLHLRECAACTAAWEREHAVLAGLRTLRAEQSRVQAPVRVERRLIAAYQGHAGLGVNRVERMRPGWVPLVTWFSAAGGARDSRAAAGARSRASSGAALGAECDALRGRAAIAGDGIGRERLYPAPQRRRARCRRRDELGASGISPARRFWPWGLKSATTVRRSRSPPM